MPQDKRGKFDVKRSNYFQGMMLVDTDFKDEQGYHRQMRHNHNLELHTWGVVRGLEVSRGAGGAITVAEGLAISAGGIELWWKGGTPQVAGEIGEGNSLVIEWSQEERDVYLQMSDKPLRLIDTVKFSWKRAADGDVVLAQIVNGQPDNSVRRMAASLRAGGNDLEMRPPTKDGALRFVTAGGQLTIDSAGRVGVGTGTSGLNGRLEIGNPGAATRVKFGGTGADADIHHLSSNRDLVFNATSGVFTFRKLTSFDDLGGFTDLLKIGPQGNMKTTGGIVCGGTLSFADDQGKTYADGWIGKWDGDSDKVKWMHIGGITENGARRLLLAADKTRISGNVGIDMPPTEARLSIRTNPGPYAGNLLEFAAAQYKLRLRSESREANSVSYHFDLINNLTKAENMLVFNKGNVGIGTPDPRAPLHVKFPAGGGTAAVFNLEGSDHVFMQWYPLGYASGRKGWMGYEKASDQHLTICNEAPDSNIVLYPTRGRVSVWSKLQVMNSTAGIVFEPSNGSPNAGYIRFGDSTGWKLHFGPHKSGANEIIGTDGTVMTLQDQGKVGIGTTNPGGQLEVRNPSTEVKVKFGGAGGDVHHLSSTRDLVFNTVSGIFTFRKLTSSYDQLETGNFEDMVRIIPEGLVVDKGGISCGGRVRFKSSKWSSYISARGAADKASVWMMAAPGDYEEFSLEMACSRDYKENIAELSIEEARATLQNLNPVKYDYKGERTFRQNLGFIAEEMPDNLASADRKTISPFEVIPVLTRVAKEQQQRIAQLEAMLRALQEA